jgi:hypothetical protein
MGNNNMGNSNNMVQDRVAPLYIHNIVPSLEDDRIGGDPLLYLD